MAQLLLGTQAILAYSQATRNQLLAHMKTLKLFMHLVAIMLAVQPHTTQLTLAFTMATTMMAQSTLMNFICFMAHGQTLLL
jgi:hypothetical protein